MSPNDVPVSMIYPVLKTMVLKGYDAAAFCRYASIEEKLLQNAEARIEAELLENVMEAAAAFTGDKAFGLHQGQIVEMADFGILGYVMMHSGTILHALEAFQRYNVIVCSGYNFAWDVQGEDVRIGLRVRGPVRRSSRHCVEEVMSSLYHVMLKLGCRSIPVKDVHFTHSALESAPSEHIAVWGIEPRFDSEATFLLIGKEVLHYPVVWSDSRLRSVFETMAEETRAKLVQGQPFSDKLYEWIIGSMPTYFPSLQDTAEAFHMSARTMQARLSQERTSYNQIANRVRKELAIRYLRQPDYTVGEIAYLLHYSEPSAFQNAFKKWTGLSPGQYRTEAAQA